MQGNLIVAVSELPFEEFLEELLNLSSTFE